MEADRTDLRLPRITRPRLVAGFVAGAVLLTATAYAVGTQMHSPAEMTVPIVAAVQPTFAMVEKRRVGELPSVDGTFAAGRTVDVPATLPSGAQRTVVDSTTLRPGSTVSSGRVLAVVSGRPLIAVTMPIPLSRSVAFGDRGLDVRKVEVLMADLGYLHRSVDDVYGPALQVAVARFYRDRGFAAPSAASQPSDLTAGAPLPTGTKTAGSSGDLATPTPAAVVPGSFVSMDELVALARPAVVQSIAAPGAVLTAGSVLARLRLGRPSIKARVDVDAATRFRVGTHVRIQIPGVGDTTYQGVVSTRSGFRPAGGGTQLPGYDITVTPTTAGSGLTAGQSLRITPATDAETPSTAVPLVALRQDAAGTYVLRQPARDRSGTARRVPVTVQAQADGWVSVAAHGAISPGDRVQVAP